MQRLTRSVLFAVVVGLVMGGLAHARPPATESGFVQVEDDVRLFCQRFGTGTPKVIPNRLELVTSFYPHPESVERVVASAPFEIAVELGAPPDRVEAANL